MRASLAPRLARARTRPKARQPPSETTGGATIAIAVVLLLGFLMVARAGARVNKIALASLPVGVTAVLHTWSQTLLDHYHLHCIVTGGGLVPVSAALVPHRSRTTRPAGLSC